MNGNTGLIPLTKIKIPMDKWLETHIKYEEDFCVKDVVEMISEKVYRWIQEREDLHILTDNDSFREELINLLYDKYLQ